MRKQITLYADEGKIITDGENFSETFSVEVNGDDSKYYEITQEEYSKIKEEIIKPAEV